MIPQSIKEKLLGNQVTACSYAFVKKWYLYFLVKRANRRLMKLGGEVFNRIYAVMSKHGYPYFANYGTLLGIIRENGFLKNDDDIDLSVPAGAVTAKEVVSAFDKENDFEFLLGYAWQGRVTEIAVSCMGVHIDFFFQYVENGVNYSHWYDPVNGRFSDEHGRFAFRRPIPVAVDVETRLVLGGKVPIPQNAAAILESCYGNWKVPRDKYLCKDYEDVRPPKVLLKERGLLVSKEFILGNEV